MDPTFCKGCNRWIGTDESPDCEGLCERCDDVVQAVSVADDLMRAAEAYGFEGEELTMLRPLFVQHQLTLLRERKPELDPDY